MGVMKSASRLNSSSPLKARATVMPSNTKRKKSFKEADCQAAAAALFHRSLPGYNEKTAHHMDEQGVAWTLLPVEASQLDLELCLDGGQTFLWENTGIEEWTTVFFKRIVSLKKMNDKIYFKIVQEQEREQEQGAANYRLIYDCLVNYLRLEIDTSKLFAFWHQRDPHFAKKSELIGPGLRVLRQSPFSTLISFICSANNQISRIKSMIWTFMTQYGVKIGDYRGVSFHAFPELETMTRLAKERDLESELRALGFGYRARYLHKTMLQLGNQFSTTDAFESWIRSCYKSASPNPHDGPVLDSKRQLKGRADKASLLPRTTSESRYLTSIERLVAFHGVGRKVADCVALFSLDHFECIPVDTHVWQVSRRDYGLVAGGKHATLTPVAYETIRKFFVELFVHYPGWAHSVLFTADLKKFSDRTGRRVP